MFSSRLAYVKIDRVRSLIEPSQFGSNIVSDILLPVFAVINPIFVAYVSFIVLILLKEAIDPALDQDSSSDFSLES